MYMHIVYCILYIDIGDEINNSFIYFVQTNYPSCCSYLKYHFPKYLIFNAHGINGWYIVYRYSPVNIWYDLKQIATEFFSAGMHSREVSLKCI